MGLTVIASLIVLNSGSPDRPTRGGVPDQVATQPSEPTFLQHVVPTHSNPPPAIADTALSNSVGQQRARLGEPYPPINDRRSSLQLETPSQGRAAEGAAFAREQAFNAALKRSAIARDEGGVTEPAAGQEGPAVSSRSSPLAAEEEHLVAYGDSLLRGSAQKAAASLEPTSAPVVPSSTRRAFLQQAGDAGGKTVLARIEQVSSPYVLQAGTVIPAILLTAITSDLPGDCMGQVTRDVFDSRTQRTMLIPKGSKLMCRYDDQVAAGQGRLLIAWTRLLLPDGRGMTLPGLALKDAQGQTGAKGDVDNHTRRVFGRALLLSAIGAGAQLSQPRQGSILAAPTTGQVAAGAVGQELSNVALEVLRRGMEQPPTITVQQGQTFNVFLNGDLVFDGPYESGQ
jgi:type IV secretion system protein VirB10